MNKKQIQSKYDELSSWYDLGSAFTELLGVRRLRRELLREARGEVLELAIGTGKNLRFYPPGCRVTGSGLSAGMLKVRRRRAQKLGLSARLLVGDAETVPFPDRSFDVVVDSLSLCTFQDPVAALGEMARVSKRDGQILLLEHGRSNCRWLGRWQDRRDAAHAEKLCCHVNREPLEMVARAGLTLIESWRLFLGTFHVIRAAPGPTP